MELGHVGGIGDCEEQPCKNENHSRRFQENVRRYIGDNRYKPCSWEKEKWGITPSKA